MLRCCVYFTVLAFAFICVGRVNISCPLPYFLYLRRSSEPARKFVCSDQAIIAKPGFSASAAVTSSLSNLKIKKPASSFKHY